MSDTFLPPIEKPQGLMMKLAFYFTRRQFGRVLTPLKVHSARLPPAFGMFYGKVAKLDPRAGGPDQHLPFLHGHWPLGRDQRIDERGQARRAGALCHQRAFHRR